MDEFKETFEEIIKGIKTGQNENEHFDNLIRLYTSSSPEERDFIRKNIDNKTATLLISYSHTVAVECVRKKSSDKLFDGFVAQSIEDSRIDYRDNIIVLFLLYNSAKRLGVDIKLLVQKVCVLSSNQFAEMLAEFINRKDLDDDLVKLSGYKAVEQPQFNYVWVK
jgi:hypothetical protein